MFCFEDKEENIVYRFTERKYARKFMIATFNEKIARLKSNNRRYEIIEQTLNRNNFKIVFIDNGRKYFLKIESDKKEVVCIGILYDDKEK
jgi:hypothetical protein